MILVGTSGYSYTDWRGAFYPPRLPPGEMLAFYARRFPAVEIDYTYYRMPTAQTLGAMERKTPDGFRFAVKLHRSLTHELPPTLPEMAANEREFVTALAPLADAGKLGCLLAQFPFSFRASPANRDYLRGLVERLALPLVVEFRNREWAVPETPALLSELGAGYCCVDEPALAGLMPREAITTGPVAYLRFHGRNAAKWWNHKEAWERYDYLYSEEELKAALPDIAALDRQSDLTYVMFNNCHAGQAARNASALQDLLGLAPAPAGALDHEPPSGQLKLF